MNAALQQPVIELGVITVLRQQAGYAHRIYHLNPEAAQFTDRALLEWCGYTPYFGGEVQRTADGVRVRVNTD